MGSMPAMPPPAGGGLLWASDGGVAVSWRALVGGGCGCGWLMGVASFSSSLVRLWGGVAPLPRCVGVPLVSRCTPGTRCRGRR
jgi:hypothetical protein